MPAHVLLTWLGQHDLDAAFEKKEAGLGPIASALESGLYKRLVVLSNYDEEKSRLYCSWIEVMYPRVVTILYPVDLTSPTDYEEIYTACEGVLQQEESDDTELTFHLSPGTPAMASVWILLASGRSRTRLIETHRDEGLKEVRLPFDIFARYRPEKTLASHISAIDDALLPGSPAFDGIIHESAEMRRAVAKAKRAAVFEVPMLLSGESGTGKELFARAVHHASTRSSGPFIAVNCGAIPESLAESVFFGHAKGAFTGAVEMRPGYLEMADGGTLFLDEIGELSRDLQVKLLRVLNDKKLRRLGENQVRELDFRLISATNHNLALDAARGRFRTDLFHRIAVGVIKLPTLRERGQDLPLLTRHICTRLNREFSSTPGWQEKSLSPGAMRAIGRHHWPGNIRELINTLTRAFVFSGGTEIDETAIRDSLIDFDTSSDGLLDRPLGDEFSIEEIISLTAVHYLERAMKQAGGNKTRAAKLLGLNSYQTLSNWLERYGVEEDF
ncbi:sigma 54-interacting transcriptional regulator [Marispirochaeta aestuarii]|uniref:sigma-54 interaction domain-containing protein n=1 Tax=Marispirochaeta aestuarii TaxID=1963862 RepID=UPI0029C712E7|nr:sigma 54-interacting transcriptional regulator [Marispirochaeta aestuarii]